MFPHRIERWLAATKGLDAQILAVHLTAKARTEIKTTLRSDCITWVNTAHIEGLDVFFDPKSHTCFKLTVGVRGQTSVPGPKYAQICRAKVLAERAHM